MTPQLQAVPDFVLRNNCERLDPSPRVAPTLRYERIHLMRRKFVALLLSALAILPWALLVIIPALALSAWAAGIGH